jgi:predicted Zn-dependent protease
VTRGLMDLLNDDELAAAIAHELGHLINDGHLHTVVSLRGYCRTPDAEARADATGVELLRSRGINPGSMDRMLRKIENCPEIGPRCRSGLAWRLRLVDESLGTAKFVASNKPSS